MLEDTLMIDFLVLETLFEEHLTNLQHEMTQDMPEINNLQNKSWIRNPFDVNVLEFGDDVIGFKKVLYLLIFKKIKLKKSNLVRFHAEIFGLLEDKRSCLNIVAISNAISKNLPALDAGLKS